MKIHGRKYIPNTLNYPDYDRLVEFSTQRNTERKAFHEYMMKTMIRYIANSLGYLLFKPMLDKALSTEKKDSL